MHNTRDTFCFFKHIVCKEYKMWWRSKNRSAFAEATSASDTISLSVCEWNTSFPIFVSQRQTHKRNIKTIRLQTEPWLVRQAVFQRLIASSSNTDVKQWVPLWVLSNTPTVAQVEQRFYRTAGFDPFLHLNMKGVWVSISISWSSWNRHAEGWLRDSSTRTWTHQKL